MVRFVLLGAVALAGCVATEGDSSVTLAMAPAADAEPTVYAQLPDSVSVLPVPSSAYADASALLPAEADAAARSDTASPPEPVTTDKQGRLVARRSATSLPLVAPPLSPEPELVALAEEKAPTRKSLAQSALSLVSLGKPEVGQNEVDRLIEKYAELYDVPVALVRRVVKRESNFRPGATNRGHYGLMQIKHATARSMGYKGSALGLLDAETNLKYAVKYLRGAFLVAGGNHDRADRFYQSGYYYDAKRKGLLDETGLGKDRRRRSG